MSHTHGMDPRDLRRIAEAIAQRIVGSSATASSPSPSAPRAALGDGLFGSIDEAARAARTAFVALTAVKLEKRTVIVEAMRQVMRREAANLARMAVEETGLGRYEDKIGKNLLVTNKTPGTEDLTPIAKTGDHGLMLLEPAPFGVIGAITPVTNPPSTIICNSIAMLAAGNTVVFNPHP